MLKILDVDLTPNPQALKFILSENLLNIETRSFNTKEQAAKDPLAKLIFELEGVVSVFYMDRFITIEKEPSISWGKIQKPFAEIIESFDISTIPAEKPFEGKSEDETATLKKINEIIDLRIKPALAGDGGGLEVLGFEENTLTIRYQGACGSCPSSIRGTLVAIENLLRREVNPDISVISG
ncbi:MAG: NifU family protein [Bacteroidetes bacterium]|nr:NifU family protein [Bacteroidota bacterium]MBU1113732.1 NifU family protein [Bacteroidota bacterium]MBU1799368.1 NifU family protein [Bacteroidota bacterium]